MWYREADIPSNFTAAGGMAGLEEIWRSSYRQQDFANNVDSDYQALYRAYDERISAIAEATGERVENPLRIAEQLDFEAMQKPRRPTYMQPLYDPALFEGPAMPTSSQREAQKFSTWLTEIETRYPDKKSAIRASVPVARDAEAIAKASEADAEKNFASSSNPLRWIAALGGASAAYMKEPLQFTTMFAGGGPNAARSVAGRIVSGALKEALVNGVAEAAFQPKIQAWREKAGLPAGWDEGVRNVLFAAGLGGAFGAGAEVLAAGGRRLFTGEWLDKAAEHASRTAPLSAEVKAGLDGKLDAAIEAIKPIRQALPAEARAAIDLHETLSVARAEVPNPAAPVVHERNLDMAAKVAEDPAHYAPDFEIDQGKIERIVRELVPDAPKTRKATDTGLAEFLMRAGGVQDQKGEITALGLQNASQRFQGRLVREDGRTLDYARELAAEAGYFNHRYGTADEAVANSTVADLLDELDAGSRRTAAPDDDGGRAYLESRVEELVRLVGPEVDEKLIARAVQRSESEGIDLVEAFDREAVFEDAARFDIAEDVAAARRADPLTRDTMAPEPDAIDEDEFLDYRDLEDMDPDMTIPFFDDAPPVTAGQLVSDIDALDAMTRATEVCRL